VISALFAASDRASRTIHPASRDVIRYPNATNPIMATIAPDTNQRRVTGAMGFWHPHRKGDAIESVICGRDCGLGMVRTIRRSRHATQAGAHHASDAAPRGRRPTARGNSPAWQPESVSIKSGTLQTTGEIRRCLKRYIAREIYRTLTATMTPSQA
jgi:hypothetical protein